MNFLLIFITLFKFFYLFFLQDASIDEILEFLDKAEAAGQNVMSVIGSQVSTARAYDDSYTQSVSAVMPKQKKVLEA